MAGGSAPGGSPESADTTKAAFATGELVVGGQYRVRRPLGSGGFGDVFEVETVVGGLRRALKVLSEHWARDADARQRFIQEAVLLERVNHPNVARCFSVGTMDDGQRLYLLMELVEGGSLTDLMRTQPGQPLSPARAVRFAKQIAAGLVAAHANEVLHRDLKPDNIVLDRAHTRDEQAKVVDFGIAKWLDADGAYTRNIIGTPDFMAPEQFTPGAELGPALDLWQLGALLHYMLTAQPPYRALDSQGPLSVHHQQMARLGLGPMPNETLPGAKQVHPLLDRLVGRLLATEVEERPSSAAQVCSELARVEQLLLHGSSPKREYAVLEALCGEPSRLGWWTLCEYLADRSDVDAQVAVAERLLKSWPDELRLATTEMWETVRRGEAHPLWPLVRSLDLRSRGLSDEDVVELAGCRALSTLRQLWLSGNCIGAEGARALAGSPHLGRLQGLSLAENDLDSAAVVSLSERGGLPSLTSLDLEGNQIGTVGVKAVCHGAWPLSALNLSGNGLGPTAAVVLGNSPLAAGLEELRLGRNRLGPDGVASLAASGQLRDLTLLDLSHNQAGPSGAAAVAISAALRRLCVLNLAGNRLGSEGLKLLVGSSHFTRLLELDLSTNQLDPQAAMALAAAPLVRRLQTLVLDNNAFGDAGLAALLGSAQLGGLHELSLGHNALTAAGVALLGDSLPQLESLSLAGNGLGAAGGQALAGALERSNIRRLDVTSCGLSGEHLAACIEASGGTLETLCAGRNPLKAADIRLLGQCSHASSLREIDLSGTALGSDGAAELAAAARLDGVRTLRLASTALTDRGLAALLSSHGSGQLDHLDVSDNGLTADSVRPLREATMTPQLATLDLSHNRLGDAGAEALAEGETWLNLRDLRLSDNDLSMAGASAVLNAPGLRGLSHVALDHNSLRGEVDVFGLPKDTLGLMQESFALARDMGPAFAEAFYTKLFARYPSVKPLFAKTNMARQRDHLMGSLALVIDNLRRPEHVEAELRELALRHIGYGVMPPHYYGLSATLLETLREISGDRWTEALEAAWSEGLHAIINVMLDAHREGRRSPDSSDGSDTRR